MDFIWELENVPGTVKIIENEIIEISHVDAIVNTSDKKFSGGNAVDKQIQSEAGQDLKEELQGKKLQSGEVVVTSAYGLGSAQNIIHMVTPKYKDGLSAEKEELEGILRACLECAKGNEFQTVAFPALTMGVHKYPLEEAALIYSDTICSWLMDCGCEMDITIVTPTFKDYTAYRNAFYEHQMKNGGAPVKEPEEPVFGFKEGDRILHKKWGEGVIQKVGTACLVEFPGVGQKNIAGSWIEKNCQIL